MTIRSEILDILTRAGKPLTSTQIFGAASEALTKQQVAQNLHAMKQESIIEPAGKTEGNGTSPVNLWRIASGGGCRSQSPWPRKTAKKRAGKGAAKKGRIDFPKPAGDWGNVIGAHVPGVGVVGLDQPIRAAARWALASDGAFVLLGTPTEITRAAARALVDFVRVLDQAEA